MESDKSERHSSDFAGVRRPGGDNNKSIQNFEEIDSYLREEEIKNTSHEGETDIEGSDEDDEEGNDFGDYQMFQSTFVRNFQWELPSISGKTLWPVK